MAKSFTGVTFPHSFSHAPGFQDDAYKWNGNLGNQAAVSPNGKLYVYPYDVAQTQTTVASGFIWATEFTCDSPFLARQLFYHCSTAVVLGAGSVTAGQLALFSVSGTTYTLLQATTNDTHLFDATGIVGRSISSQLIIPGIRYAVGMLGVFANVTTTPQALQMTGAVAGQYNNGGANNLINLCAGSAGSLTAMATFTASGVSNRRFWYMVGN